MSIDQREGVTFSRERTAHSKLRARPGNLERCDSSSGPAHLVQLTVLEHRDGAQYNMAANALTLVE